MPRLQPLSGSLILGAALFASTLFGSTPALAAPDTGNQFVAQPEAGQPAAEIGKGYFTLALRPGETHAVSVALKNTGATELPLVAYAVDGLQISGGVDYPRRGTTPSQVGAWTTLGTDHLTLQPGETERVIASVTVPADATPGDHVGGIALEEDRVYGQGAGSNTLIDVRYRQVLGVVVTTPGARITGAELGGVTLAEAGAGSQAQVALHNTGNGLLRARGTIEIGGDGAGSGALPFQVGTTLPGATQSVPVALPQLALQPGAYDVQVHLTAEDGSPLASWAGSVSLGAAETAPTTAPRVLAPAQAAPAQEPAALPATLPTAAAPFGNGPILLLGGLLIGLLALAGAGLLVVLRRTAVRPS
jgi:hypothetical protein